MIRLDRVREANERKREQLLERCRCLAVQRDTEAREVDLCSMGLVFFGECAVNREAEVDEMEGPRFKAEALLAGDYPSSLDKETIYSFMSLLSVVPLKEEHLRMLLRCLEQVELYQWLPSSFIHSLISLLSAEFRLPSLDLLLCQLVEKLPVFWRNSPNRKTLLMALESILNRSLQLEKAHQLLLT